jgi:hypothetical protein
MKKLALLLLLAGCASAPPAGHGVLVLPGSGKSFDAFRADDSDCRQYATSQVGGTTAQQAANDAGVQQRYDFGYTQCMYAKGHKVPVAGRYSDRPAPRRSATVPPPPPPSASIPPPPPGTPPGTPPDYRVN